LPGRTRATTPAITTPDPLSNDNQGETCPASTLGERPMTIRKTQHNNETTGSS
jgi:hypothetical protein